MGQELEEIKIPIYSVDSQSIESLTSAGMVPEGVDYIDITPGALKELYEIKHPERKDKFLDTEFEEFLNENRIDASNYGCYVYYEWCNLLMKIPPKADLQLLRTARNHLLITPDEQQVLFTKTILIAGMSVGSNVLEQLAHGGIGGTYILADMDTLEITNLNRIKTGLPDVTTPKVTSAARRALELDPYLNVIILPKGIQKESLDSVCELLNVDLFVDEVDDISVKVLLRQKAKDKKRPLLMATDNSDGALIDIERYDINPNQVMFGDRIPGDVLEKMVSGELSREEAGAAIGRFFVGLDIVDNRLIGSLMEVRKTIPSWPQLGTAASMSGILVAFATKQILLGGLIASDRYVASFDKEMNPELQTEKYATQRQELLTRMRSSN